MQTLVEIWNIDEILCIYMSIKWDGYPSSITDIWWFVHTTPQYHLYWPSHYSFYRQVRPHRLPPLGQESLGDMDSTPSPPRRKKSSNRPPTPATNGAGGSPSLQRHSVRSNEEGLVDHFIQETSTGFKGCRMKVRVQYTIISNRPTGIREYYNSHYSVIYKLKTVVPLVFTVDF